MRENLYALTFEPIFKERIWGGTGLRDKLNKNTTTDKIGESWEISGIQEDMSIVSNGTLKGKTLQELINIYKEDLLGKSVWQRFKDDFPILIKFIDTQQDLSIQVHPNDNTAKKRHQSRGKTEMWFVMEGSEIDAQLMIGFNKNMNQTIYRKALEEAKLEQFLNYQFVRPQEAFFIETGMIHAIGKGVLLAEIQQSSDVTYRIYDYNRVDDLGNKRELHTEESLDVLEYHKKDDFQIRYNQELNEVNEMVNTPYFITNYIRLEKNKPMDLSHRDSFTILMCVSGTGIINNDSDAIQMFKGQTVLIPAISIHIYIETSDIVLLEVYL